MALAVCYSHTEKISSTDPDLSQEVERGNSIACRNIPSNLWEFHGHKFQPTCLSFRLLLLNWPMHPTEVPPLQFEPTSIFLPKLSSYHMMCHLPHSLSLDHNVLLPQQAYPLSMILLHSSNNLFVCLFLLSLSLLFFLC